MEIYISAKWFFDELDKKLALTKSKMSMRELQDATGVNRAILKKLKDEECTVISSDTMKKLYAYAVAAGSIGLGSNKRSDAPGCTIVRPGTGLDGGASSECGEGIHGFGSWISGENLNNCSFPSPF